MQAFAEWLSGLLRIPSEPIKKVALTIFVLTAYTITRRLTTRVIGRRFEEPATRFRVNQAIRVVLLVVGVAVLVRIWVNGTEGIGTYLGLLTAGIAVALQEPVQNLAGWFYIIVSRPFRVGDRIQIGEHAGDVVDVRPFSFALLEIGNWVHADQSTGRLLQIPNGWLFKQSVAGYDHGFPFIWNEIQVTVTFEADWRAAKRALEKVLEDHAERVEDEEFARPSEFIGIQYSRLTPVVWIDTTKDGIRLTMRYLCRPRNRRVSTSVMWEAILDAFAALPAVDFAYPTTRFFDHSHEGKPDLRDLAKPSEPSDPK